MLKALFCYHRNFHGAQVKSESKKVWKFIIEREIEAPARFQAIQTHRAVMAILQQQVSADTVQHWAYIQETCLIKGHPCSLQTGQQGTSETLTMAHLPEQARFVEQLYGSGMVDEAEKEALVEPIERLERRLMRRGGLGWRSPRVDEVCCCRITARILPAWHSIAAHSALQGSTFEGLRLLEGGAADSL